MGSELNQIKEKYETWNKDFQAGQTASEVVIKSDEEVSTEEIAAAVEQDNGSTAIDEVNTDEQTEAVVLADPVREPGPGFGGVVLGAAGPLLNRLGWLTRTIAHESIFYDDDNIPIVPTYGNLAYNAANVGKPLLWTSLGLSGGGGLAESILFPYKSYTLTPAGKALYAGGEIFDVVGNTLGLMSQMLRADLAMVGYQYDTAETQGIEDITTELDGLEKLYSLTRLGSYGAWVLGTAASVTAPLFRGNRTLSVTGPLQATLHTAGSMFTILGDLASLLSYNAKLIEDQKAEEYRRIETIGEITTAYESYQTIYNIYVISTIGAYGFWGLGALSSILAVVLPENTGGGSLSPEESPDGKPRPEPLFTVEPRENRVFAGFRISM